MEECSSLQSNKVSFAVNVVQAIMGHRKNIREEDDGEKSKSRL